MSNIDMPKWNDLFLPTLKAYGDGKPHNNRLVKVEVADGLNLSDELRHEKNAKIGDNKIENRVGWAISALKTAGLLRQYELGSNIITELGVDLLATRGGKNFDEKYLLENYPPYKENYERNIRNYKNKKIKSGEEQQLKNSTPEELIENAFNRLDAKLQTELLKQLCDMSPYDFETVVADLLKAMGYGESFTTKKSNDGGVDAIVNEDALGLSKIYAQAKRYAHNNLVQQKAIQDFLGSLVANDISKGIFITTSDFSKNAESLAKNKSVILINGDELTRLMIEYNIGVSGYKTYQVKRIDSDYFASMES
ncbi:restriction endonuclease [Candidatus Saccharibacteria bacterium]|nr:restriction endonuclease [Candidatus Saccharibacteria bacterium]